MIAVALFPRGGWQHSFAPFKVQGEWFALMDGSLKNVQMCVFKKNEGDVFVSLP